MTREVDAVNMKEGGIPPAPGPFYGNEAEVHYCQVVQLVMIVAASAINKCRLAQYHIVPLSQRL